MKASLEKKGKAAFATTLEDIHNNLFSDGEKGIEPLGSNGSEHTHCNFIRRPQLIYNILSNYLHKFTNPPL